MPFTVLYVGANYNNANANNGVFYFNRNNESNSNANYGARLLSQIIQVPSILAPWQKIISYRVRLSRAETLRKAVRENRS